MGLDKLANTFTEILKAPSKDTKPYDTEAEVTRIDDDGKTAWVHIPGGIDETPVEMTMAAKKGDKIKIRVSGGRAWIAGNGSAPPTDNTVANRAYVRANSAANEAIEAKEAASIAKTAADEARQSASDANYYANGALTSLSVVEDVVGTLNWISQHGTYSLTTDTAVDPDKIYFVYNFGTYTPVIEPKVEDISTYYELNLDSTMQTYISSHLALTNDGLWVVKDNQAYKILLSNTGLRVYDASGNIVSTFGQNVSFSSNVPQTIGSEAAKISFNPTNGQITISGNVIFSNVEAIQDLQDQIDGRKTNWYYEVDPEDNTDPDLIWSTDEEKERHVGDLYYNTSNGHCWRWLKSTDGGVTTYSWSQIQDSDAAEAKSIAEAAAKETQLIYTQSANATGHIALPTAWVAEYDEPTSTTPVHWTRKRPTYHSTMPVTWVATQIRSMKGDITILNNTAYIDDTLTVIDGGHILAGSIDAAKINVQDLVTSGSLIVEGDDLSKLNDDVGFQTAQDVEDIISDTSVEALSDGNLYAKKTGVIASAVPIYYRKNSVNPQTPPNAIGTANDVDDAWEYVMPVPKRNRTFYTCERYVYADGAISYSEIRELSSETYESKWVHSADSTYIDGGRLYAESVTADRLAANSITIGKMNSEAKAAVMNSKVYPIGVNNGTVGYHFLGTLTLPGQTDEAEIEIHTGDGQNNQARQNLTIYVNIKRGWQPSVEVTAGITVQYDGDPTIITMAEEQCKIIVRCTEIGVMNVYLHTPTWHYADGWYQVKGRNYTWVHSGTIVTTEPSEGTAQTIASTNPYTKATSYITDITDAGIFISPENQNPTTASPGNSVLIDGTGMEVFNDGVSMAKYGETVRVGKEAEEHIELSSDGFNILSNNMLLMNIDIDGAETQSRSVSGKIQNSVTSSFRTALYGVIPNSNIEAYVGTQLVHTFVEGTYGTYVHTLDGGKQIRISYSQPYYFSMVPVENLSSQLTVSVTYQSYSPNINTTIGTRKTPHMKGNNSFTCGKDCNASDDYGVAFGSNCTAGRGGFAAGINCSAADCSAAFGSNARALGLTDGSAFAFGDHVVAFSANQIALGEYNDYSSDDYARFMIGNGTSEERRSNSFSINNTGVISFGNPHATFVQEEHYIATDKTIASGGYSATTTTFTKAGYFPIAIIGWYSSNRWFCLNRCRLTTRSEGSASVYWLIYNASSESKQGSVSLDILWVKLT